MIRNWELDHITLAVYNNQEAMNKFVDIFGGEFLKDVSLESLGARASYVNLRDIVIGLESAIEENSDIARFIKKRGEGIHHVAFLVPDLKQVEDELLHMGLTLIGPEVYEGVKSDLFIHPKSCFGVLVQLTEWEEPYKSSFKKRAEILGRHD